MMEQIKEQILTRFNKALSTGQPLPLKDLIGIGQVIASLEQNEVARTTIEITKEAVTNRPTEIVEEETTM
ncbi:MAG: hypothetical protein R3Y05_01415 [bacterium]